MQIAQFFISFIFLLLVMGTGYMLKYLHEVFRYRTKYFKTITFFLTSIVTAAGMIMLDIYLMFA